MSMVKLSVVVDTYNKEKDLARCLESVTGLADEIVVCDEESTDNTVEIAKRFGAKIVTHKTVPYVELIRNFEVSKALGEWILIVDPDEEIPTSLVKKIRDTLKNPKADYYRLLRKNIVFGKWLKHSRWWPDYNIRLFRKGYVSWSEVIHAVPITKGRGRDFQEKEDFAIIHYHYETIEQYVERMNRYTSAQAEMKISEGHKFSWKDLITKPADEFLSRYFFGGGYKDGVHGLAVSLLQGFSEAAVYLKVWQHEKFRQTEPNLTDIVSTMRKKEKDFRYWQADASFNENRSLIEKIRRRLRI